MEAKREFLEHIKEDLGKTFIGFGVRVKEKGVDFGMKGLSKHKDWY